MLGRRAKGGWVLSRFALHAPELSAEVGEDPLVRLPRELITSAILPSLDATEDHDFDVIRRDDYIPSPHPPILLLYPCRATYRAEHSLLFSTYLMPALLSFFLPSLFSFFFLSLFIYFLRSSSIPSPLLSFPFPFSLSSFSLFFLFLFFLLSPAPFHHFTRPFHGEKRSPLGFGNRDPIADDLRAAGTGRALASTSVRFSSFDNR